MAKQTGYNATTATTFRLHRSPLRAYNALSTDTFIQKILPSFSRPLRINPIGIRPKRILQTRFIDISASLALHRKAID